LLVDRYLYHLLKSAIGRLSNPDSQDFRIVQVKRKFYIMDLAEEESFMNVGAEAGPSTSPSLMSPLVPGANPEGMSKNQMKKANRKVRLLIDAGETQLTGRRNCLLPGLKSEPLKGLERGNATRNERRGTLQEHCRLRR